MTRDLNKDISIVQYNSLNLPDCFQTTGGERESFLYDYYDGNKLYANATTGMVMTTHITRDIITRTWNT